MSEIKKLAYKRKPELLCLTETWLNIKLPKFQGYIAEWKNRDAHGGGLGILIRLDVQYQSIDINIFPQGLLEVQAVKIKLRDNSDCYICNMYNPGKNISIQEMKHYIKQLGNTFIILGDLNAHTLALDNKYNTRTNLTENNREHYNK